MLFIFLALSSRDILRALAQPRGGQEQCRLIPGPDSPYPAVWPFVECSSLWRHDMKKYFVQPQYSLLTATSTETSLPPLCVS